MSPATEGDGLYHRPLGGRLRKGEIPRGRDLAGLGGYPRWRTAPSASRPAGQRLAPTRVRPEKHPHSSKICALVKAYPPRLCQNIPYFLSFKNVPF